MADKQADGTTGPKPGRNWRRRAGRALGGLLIVLVGLILLGVALFRYERERSFPQTSGTAELRGLQATVEVIRDSRGVPHIYASNVDDLFRGQGYVHAQDRFWQMDVWRHAGSGQLAELFGADMVPTDRFIRTLGWRRSAQWQLDDATPKAQLMLRSYADGVNGFLQQHEANEISFEYRLLGRSGADKPGPWEPIHSVTWGMAMAWDLRGNIDEEIARATLLDHGLSAEQVDQIYAPYPFDIHPTIIGDGDASADASTQNTGRQLAGAGEALRRVAHNAGALDAVTGGGGAGLGSNSWVLSGKRTATGMPILANDPHLGIQMPSIWHQIGLHCRPVTEECPVDVVGFSFAGMPGVVIGHNRHIAWGFTNLYADVMDLYVERLHPEDENRYDVNGDWAEMDVRTETIEVRGGEPVEVEIRETRHGPIVSDVYSHLRGPGRFKTASGSKVPERHAVALRWTALEPGGSIVEAIASLDTAHDWESFRDALRHFTFPAQNVVYADVEGNIGYQTPGRIPIRSAGDGRFPVPGWGDSNEWTGIIDFDDLPRSFNPPRGWIATANNAIVGREASKRLGADYCFGYRARRIVDRLEDRTGVDVADMAEMQLDAFSINADRVIPYLAEVDLQGNQRSERLRTQLMDWDRVFHRDSAAAAIYAAFWRKLLEGTFHDDLPEHLHPTGSGRWYHAVEQMLERPDDPFWDDRDTLVATERRDDMLRRALERADRELLEVLGPDPTSWRWGRMHHSDFVHQTLGKSGISLVERIFNRAGFPTSGGSNLVNATGWNPRRGYEVTWLPSMRMVVDLGDLSRSVTVHTTGQSGHAGHRHYDDLIPLWTGGANYPMLWDRRAVEADAEGTLRLRPMRGPDPAGEPSTPEE